MGHLKCVLTAIFLATLSIPALAEPIVIEQTFSACKEEPNKVNFCPQRGGANKAFESLASQLQRTYNEIGETLGFHVTVTPADQYPDATWIKGDRKLVFSVESLPKRDDVVTSTASDSITIDDADIFRALQEPVLEKIASAVDNAYLYNVSVVDRPDQYVASIRYEWIGKKKKCNPDQKFSHVDCDDPDYLEFQNRYRSQGNERVIAPETLPSNVVR